MSLASASSSTVILASVRTSRRSRALLDSVLKFAFAFGPVRFTSWNGGHSVGSRKDDGSRLADVYVLPWPRA